MSKPKKSVNATVVLDKSSRRRFIRASGGALLAGVSATASGNLLASDCDQGGEQSSASDQDTGEQTDPKGCKSRNIISRHQPLRETPVKVATIKA